MLISKSLLALPYGTVLTGFSDPLSSFGNPFATTIPSDTAHPQYGRMARFAGTAIAAGSVGYGAARFATFATRPRRVYLATVPFEYHGSTFNRTAIGVYDAPPTVIGPKYSFAGAYEAAFLTSLVVIDVDTLPPCPAVAVEDQDTCLVGLKGGLIVDLLDHQPLQAAPASSVTIEDADIANDETVLPTASPTISVRGSPTRPIRPTTTTSRGYENKYEYKKSLLTFVKYKYVCYASAFFIGICLAILTNLFISNDSDDEGEDQTPLTLNPVTPLLVVGVEEVREIERETNSDQLVPKLFSIARPFWEATQDCDEPHCSHDYSEDPAGDSDTESLEYEDMEVIRTLGARSNAEELPHLMIATVIMPAILVGLQTIVEEDDDAVAESIVDGIENITVVARNDNEISVSEELFYDAPITEEQGNQEESLVVPDVVLENIQSEATNDAVFDPPEAAVNLSNSALEVTKTVQSQPMRDVFGDASLDASVIETVELEPILQAIDENIPTSSIEISDAVEIEPLREVKVDRSAASDSDMDVVAAFQVESSQQVVKDEATFTSTVRLEPVQEVVEDVCAATDPDATLVAVVQWEALQEVAVVEKSFTSNDQPVEVRTKPDQRSTQNDSVSSQSDHPPRDEASLVCTSNPAIPRAGKNFSRNEVKQEQIKPMASKVISTSSSNSYNGNSIARDSVPQAIATVPATKPIKVFVGSSYRPSRNPRPRRY